MSDNLQTQQPNWEAFIAQQQEQIQQLQAQLAQIQTQSQPPILQTTPIDQPAGRLSEPKTSPPPEFDGTRARECRPFLSHCRINFQTQPSRFTTEHSKVFYAIGYLRGPAFELVEPYLDETRNLQRPAWLDTFTSFAQYINSAFGVLDEAQQAERRLRSLQQTGSAIQYYTRFLSFASLLQWDDQALRSQFYHGLKPHIKDDLAHLDRPDSLESLKDLAIRIDNRLFERLQERKDERPNGSGGSTFHPNHRFNNTMKPFIPHRPVGTGPTPMDIDALNTQSTPRGPLSEQEKQRRRQKNLCLYCGQPNHTVENCPLRPQASRSAQASELNLRLDSNYEQDNSENLQGQ